MADPQKIVTRIIEFLQANHEAPRDEVDNLAKLYAHECSRTNARLLRAGDYLRLGLLNEAVYESEIEPPLLERTASLDFPLASQWREYCTAHGFDAPEPLYMDTAQQLSAACNEFANLQELYRRNTLMALANFQLEKRLATLRAILQHQPANPAVARNICCLEEKWLDELLHATRNAEQENDAQAMADIFAKITNTVFLTGNAEKNLAAIKVIHRRYQTACGRKLLDELLPMMEEETAANNEPACRELHEKWNAILATHDIQPTPQQAHRAAPMLKFIDALDGMQAAERDFRQALRNIDAAIGDDTPDMLALRRQYRRLCDMGRAVPQELQDRYHHRIDSWEMQRRRRRRLITLAIVALIVLAGFAAFVAVNGYKRTVYLHKTAANVTAAIENRDVESAGNMLGELQRRYPSLKDTPEVQAMSNKYAHALEEAKRSDAEFDALAGKIHSADYDTPDKASLAAAEKLARTPAQKLAIAEMKNNLAQQLQKKRQLAEKEFSAKLSAVSTRLADIDPSLLDTDPEAFDRKIRMMEREVSAMEAAPLISRQVLATLNPLKVTLASYRKSQELAEKARREEDRREELRKQQQMRQNLAIILLKKAAGGNTEAYVKALEQFIRTYPDYPLSAEFSESLKLAESWQAMGAWQEIADDFKYDLGLATQKTRTARIATVNQYLTHWPKSPLAATLKSYVDMLTKAQSSLDASNSWRGELLRVLQSPAMQMDSFKTPDGKVWYIPLNSRPMESSIGLDAHVIDTLDFNNTRKMIFRKMTLEKLLCQPGPSPQTALANAIRNKLLDYNETNWNTLPLEILAAINDDKEIDPVLKANFMEVVLKLIAPACWPETPELEKAANRLSALMMSQVVWTNPESKTVQESRNLAIKAFAGLTDFKLLAKQSAEDEINLAKTILTKLRIRGTVWRNPEGKVELPQTISANCELFAVSPANGKLVKIADVKKDTVTPTDEFSRMPAGSIVYERRTGTTK